MSGLNLKGTLFYTPEEVAAIFRRERIATATRTRKRKDGTKERVEVEVDYGLRWVYRMAKDGFLKPHARKFGRMLLFSKEGVDRMMMIGAPK